MTPATDSPDSSPKARKSAKKTRKSTNDRKSTTDRTLLDRIGRILPWRKRSQSAKSKKKGHGNGKGTEAEAQKEAEAYSPKLYHAANLRAWEAAEHPVSSFSTTQVRNLHAPPLPEEVIMSRSGSMSKSSDMYRKGSYSSNYSYPASMSSSQGMYQEHDGWTSYPNDIQEHDGWTSYPNDIQVWSFAESPQQSSRLPPADAPEVINL